MLRSIKFHFALPTVVVCRWVYICDKKTHSLITPPYHLTSLVTKEEVELKFTAPAKPGHYGFTVVVRSDSYVGLDLQEDIKLDVQEAREAPTEHPQWEFEVHWPAVWRSLPSKRGKDYGTGTIFLFYESLCFWVVSFPWDYGG